MKGRIKVNKRVFNLVLGGLMVALGTVLSFIKVLDLPYGGSITLCSMLPVLVFSYRCGTKWGLGAGLVFSVLQLLFGLSALKGLTAGMLIGSVLLDYILAFTVLGFGGIFRGKIRNDGVAMTLGALVSCLLRYFCSFLSGWVLWASFTEVTEMQSFLQDWFPAAANLSGTALAVIYSLIYNGVYMIPEIIVTCVVAFLVMQFAGKYILKEQA